MTSVFPPATTNIRLALPSGRVDPFNMGFDEVKIQDILHCLPEQARFNGYTRKHYSVAQHSVLVARLAAVDHGRASTITRAALIHDAVETYTGDVVLPLKRRMPEFQKLEEGVDATVWEAFRLPFWPDHKGGLVQQIKRYDRMACTLECQQLLFYVPEEWKELRIGDAHQKAAAPLMRFMSQRKARRLLRREFASLGFGKDWCSGGSILEGWK